MNPQDNQPPVKKLPPEIEDRLRDYRKYFRAARTLHYSLGIAGVCFSLLATSGLGGGDSPRYWAFGSGVCLGIIAFADPNSRYLKFSKAARVLDSGCLKFKYGDLSVPELIGYLNQAEDIITKMEEAEPKQAKDIIPKMEEAEPKQAKDIIPKMEESQPKPDKDNP